MNRKEPYPLNIERRNLLKWTTPAVAMVVLPVHAQMSATPSLMVNKVQTGGPNPATARGDVIEYTITLENTGDMTLTNVNITDTLPDGTVAELSPVTELLTSDSVFEAGETWVYTTSYTVRLEDLVNGGNIINRVSVVTNELPSKSIDTEETPVTQVCTCSGPPVVSVSSSPKCSGSPPVGTAVFEMLAADECGAILKGITVDTNDAKSDLTGLPTLPLTITDVNGFTFTWTGPGSDGTTCLPLATISMTIEYCCGGDEDTVLTETYNITQLLIDSTTS